MSVRTLFVFAFREFPCMGWYSNTAIIKGHNASGNYIVPVLSHKKYELSVHPGQKLSESNLLSLGLYVVKLVRTFEKLERDTNLIMGCSRFQKFHFNCLLLQLLYYSPNFFFTFCVLCVDWVIYYNFINSLNLEKK